MTEHSQDLRAATGGVRIGITRAEEREAIADTARSAGVFNQEEVDTVYELFDAYVKNPASGYKFLSAYDSSGRVIGFACWGLTALTEGAYDLYWICTAGAEQQRGVGRELFEGVERDVRLHQGRLIVIWTSGTDAYIPATKFYDRMGCERAGRIRDFYRPGDDLLVFVKYLF